MSPQRKDKILGIRITAEFKAELEKYQAKINKKRKNYEVPLSLSEACTLLLVRAMEQYDQHLDN